MHAPVLITPPEESPVTLEEVKRHLHVDGADEDSLIQAYLDAAVQHFDGYSGILGRCLVQQTWRQDVDSWSKVIRLPFPALSIANVKSRNAAGQIATTDSEYYTLLRDARGSFVRFQDVFAYPSDLAETQGVMVEFVAGYGAAATVPAPLVVAILLRVGDLYANREAKVEGLEENSAVNALIAPYRLTGI